MQLVAYGAQDVYLTGNSQITFFKSLYRRHTSFSIESIQQTFSGSVSPGSRVTAVISRNGDLLHRMWLEITLPATSTSGDGTYYVQSVAHAILESAEIEIGGQRIDKVYGRWMDIWQSLSGRSEKRKGYEYMTGTPSDVAQLETPLICRGPTTFYLPLNFWFSKGSAGQALPLIALQYHEVRLTLELAPVSKWVRSLTGTTVTAGSVSVASDFVKLYCDFIFLDTEERRRFAQVSHEYLIEQLQFTGKEFASLGESKSIRLNMNHPCKELIWACYYPESEVPSTAEKGGFSPFYNGFINPDLVSGTSPYLNATADVDLRSNCPVDEVGLQLNGHERFAARKGSYFSLVQPYQHHTCVPDLSWPGVYSFSISPEEHQPSGALNFSRIDSALLTLKMKASPTAAEDAYVHDGSSAKSYDVFVYSVNYNVLRILSGMGGLAFSN